MNANDVLALPDCAERLAVACEAAWEIDALASLLQHAADSSGDAALDGLAIRGLMMRMKSLSGIVMAAVDDAADPLLQLRCGLTGEVVAEGGAV